MCGRTATGCIAVRAASERTSTAITEIGAVAGAHHARATVVTPTAAAVVAASDITTGPSLRSHNRIVEDGTSPALPVVHETLADLPHSSLYAFWGALDFDNSFGRLGKHFFLSYHADARDILDVLDLQTLPADDSAHLIVRNKEFDSCDIDVSIAPYVNKSTKKDRNKYAHVR